MYTKRAREIVRSYLAFPRYCNCQYCVVYIAITGGRGETLYCAMVRAVTVWGGVPKQRVGAQRIVLIRAQRPRHKTISCIGQVRIRPILPPVHDRGRQEQLSGGALYIYMCVCVCVYIYNALERDRAFMFEPSISCSRQATPRTALWRCAICIYVCVCVCVYICNALERDRAFMFEPPISGFVTR